MNGNVKILWMNDWKRIRDELVRLTITTEEYKRCPLKKIKNIQIADKLWNGTIEKEADKKERKEKS